MSRAGASSGDWLLVVAAPLEAAAVLRGLGGELTGREWEVVRAGRGMEVVISGIGKANAAGAAARYADPGRHGAVLSVGVAGGIGARLGEVVVASASVYADEGILTPEGFTDCAGMGFPLGPFEGSAVPASEWLLEVLRPLADRAGPVATVSTCSGVDALAGQVRERTGAVAECMEGAAVGQVCCRLGIAFGELRVISNTTGDRGRQVWDLKGALARLERLAGEVAGVHSALKSGGSGSGASNR